MDDSASAGMVPNGKPPIGTGQVLDDLAELLRRQIASASRQDYDAVRTIGETVESVLAEVLRRREHLAALPDKVRAIGQLYRDLCLSLAQEHHETAEQLRGLKHLQKALRAYGG